MSFVVIGTHVKPELIIDGQVEFLREPFKTYKEAERFVDRDISGDEDATSYEWIDEYTVHVMEDEEHVATYKINEE